MNFKWFKCFGIFILFLCQTPIVFAYIGPGTGLSAIGSFLALVFGLLIAIVGFLWFPLKRLFGRKQVLEPEIVEEPEENIKEETPEKSSQS